MRSSKTCKKTPACSKKTSNVNGKRTRSVFQSTQTRLREAEARLATSSSTTLAETTQLKEALVTQQQLTNQRTQVHVETLGALESTICGLVADCQRLQAANDGLLDEVGVMQHSMDVYKDKGGGVLEEWHQASKASLVELADQLYQAR